MATVPQVYPLWLAEIRDADMYAGRVVAWQVTEGAEAPPGVQSGLRRQPAGRPTGTPIVAFTSPDGMMLETAAPRGPLVYLADTRDEAVAAAYQVTAPADDIPGRPGHPPLPDDEDDRPRPPDPRTRVLTLRRLGEDEPADQDQAARRIHRHDH
jgi:hypothetical protein